jgi:hypothetical protein
MNVFFQDLLAISPCQSHYRPEVARLTDELIRIGQTDDFLSERPGPPFNMQCRHIRARQIGQRLDELGGLKLMAYVYRRTKRKAGKALGSHLEYCWTEVGRWVP